MEKQITYPILISIVAALGGLLFGFDFAIFSGTIPFIKPYFNLTDAELGWTSSCIYVGCIIGALSTGYFADHFGRRIPLIISAAIFAFSAICMGWAHSYALLIVARIIAGIGVGAASMLSPLYIAEVCPAKVRGRMVSINQLTIVVGILLAYTSSYFLAGAVNNWRWMFTSAAIPAIVFFVSAIFLPESPRWLDMRNEKAIAKGQLKDLVKPGILYIMTIGITVAVFQQISGANVVFVYAPVIFAKAGMNVSGQLFQQILIGAINLIFTILSMRLVDRVGRRILMLIGSIGMSVLLVLISGAFYFNYLNSPLVTILVLIFIAIYATTLAPVTWVLIAEIFPNRIRGMAVSAATTALWIACFAVVYTFPILVNYFGNRTYMNFLVFASICFVYFLFLLKYIPETKNKTLEEIEQKLLS
jgi:SP family arabinose:H+ symporter-like MFS transporter